MNDEDEPRESRALFDCTVPRTFYRAGSIAPEQVYERGVPAAGGNIQTWRRIRPKPGAPDPIELLPAELRACIYAFALPSAPTIALHAFPDPFTTEPPLLRVCKYMRREAGSAYYANSIFTMDLTLDASKLAWTIRQLAAIIEVHGSNPFRKGFKFRINGPIMRHLNLLLPLVDFVRKSGLVLLPNALRRPDKRRGPTSPFLTYQMVLDETDPDIPVLSLLHLGLVAHYHSWSHEDLKAMMAEHCGVLRKAYMRGRKEYRPESRKVTIYETEHFYLQLLPTGQLVMEASFLP